MSLIRVNPMPFIVKKFEFSGFENWPAIQNSMLPINKKMLQREEFNTHCSLA
jgi:hypothetical protein